MTDIIQACVIMHNMIIQDESGLDLEPFFDEGLMGGRMGGGLSFHELREGTREIENADNHFSLRNDLIKHLWQRRGELTREMNVVFSLLYANQTLNNFLQCMY
jgi:hypothetical protein